MENEKKKKVILVSGMSGAGKSTAARILEDMGYHVMDNFPVQLISILVDMIESSTDPRYSYVALCGVSGQAMMKQLEQQPEVHEVFLCLDNDKAGHTACVRLTEQLREQGDWKVDRLCPQNKDWNDDLRESFSQEQNQEGGMSLAL